MAVVCHLARLATTTTIGCVPLAHTDAHNVLTPVAASAAPLATCTWECASPTVLQGMYSTAIAPAKHV